MGITIGEKPVVGVITQIFGNIETETWFCGDKSTHRPAILLIHGMFGGGWYFESWARFLCEKGFVVYVIKDLHRGENLTKVDFYAYLEKSIKVVESICATIEEKIILMGHSMGGLIVQKIAEMKPELVEGLILVVSAPPKGISAMSWSVVKAMAKHLIPLIFDLPLKIDRKSTFKLILNGLNWIGDYEKREEVFQKFVPESSRVAKQLSFSRIPVDNQKNFCKSLVVAGSNDKLLPLKSQIEIAQKYDSEYYIFYNGHMMMLEDYDKKIISAIWKWIDLNVIY